MTSIVSSTSSLFTGGQSNCSTAESSTCIDTLLVQQANQAPRLPSLKASLIHIPLHLPAPPEPFEEVEERLILDDDLEGAPLGFVVHKLRSLGESNLLNESFVLGTVSLTPPDSFHRSLTTQSDDKHMSLHSSWTRTPSVPSLYSPTSLVQRFSICLQTLSHPCYPL